MFPTPPPGWQSLQQRAQEAKSARELSEIIAEMNALLDEYEGRPGKAKRSAHVAARHGDHKCVFYNTEAALLDFLVPYFVEGLSKNEYCFGAQKPHVREQLLSRLQSSGIAIDEAIHRGALEIGTDDEVYFPNKRFEPLAMMETLRQAVDNSRAKRFRGVRTAGDLTWALANPSLWRQALDYEKLVDQFIPGREMTGLCLYDAGVFGPEARAAISEVHTGRVDLPANSR